MGFVEMATLVIDPITLGLIFTCCALFSYLMLREKRTKGYPDGPSPLPIVGNIHQLMMSRNMSLIHFLEDNRRKYGNVFTVQLGGVDRVVISGYHNMYELLVKNADVSSSRTTAAMPDNYTQIAKETPGLFWAKAQHWKTIRSFALNILRSEGMGKSSLEPLIMNEVHDYIEAFITPNLGKPIVLAESMMFATANVMRVMILGSRKEYDDPAFHRWMNAFDESVKAAMKAAITKNIPLVQYIPGDLTGTKADLNAGAVVIPEAMQSVAEHKANLDPSHPHDFIDRFLVHAMKEKEKGTPDSMFTDGNAAVTMMQLYAAGTETTSTALQWALLYMCIYPEMQKRVHNEIDKQIGSSAEVQYKDRSILTYTEAVLLETLRLANIAPTALPHTLEKDMIIDGKHVPAGAELMLNMASVLSDENVFDNPSEFNPDRYLTGDTALKKARTIPFGIGRRACLGEGLAKMEFSLFFTTFMQKFKVTLPEGEKPSIEGNCSIVNAPGRYSIIFTRR